jgi:hypothetical protein
MEPLILGLPKSRTDDDDEVDDEVRTTVPSQNHAMVTLIADEFFLSIQYKTLPSYQQRSVGRDRNCRHNTYILSQLGYQLPAYRLTGFTSYTIIL